MLEFSFNITPCQVDIASQKYEKDVPVRVSLIEANQSPCAIQHYSP
jgi:hypothetical protein